MASPTSRMVLTWFGNNTRSSRYNQPMTFVIRFDVLLSRRSLHKAGTEVVHPPEAGSHEGILGFSLHARPHDPPFLRAVGETAVYIDENHLRVKACQRLGKMRCYVVRNMAVLRFAHSC